MHLWTWQKAQSVSRVHQMKYCDVQVELEFDFVKEAVSMDQISKSLQSANQGKSPIAVPRSIPGLVTKYVLLLQICVFFFLLM